MAEDYTTTAAVKRQLEIGVNGTTNTVDDDLIDLYVTQASRLIDTFTRRVFYPTTGTLYYDAAYPVINNNTLYFDQDWLSIDALSNGANGTLLTGSYRTLPLYYSPKYAVQIMDKASVSWTVGNEGYAMGAITVIGTYGYCTTANRPPDVTLAATKLAAWLYQNRNNDGSLAQLADGTTIIPAEAPQLVMKLLDKYVRRVAYSEASHL